MSEENYKKEDEVISVTMPVKDYRVLRDMIEREKSLNWLGKWLRNIFLVTIGGLITTFVFWEHITKFFKG